MRLQYRFTADSSSPAVSRALLRLAAMTSLALPRVLPTQEPQLILIMKPGASFTIFRPTSEYDIAAFAMSILQMTSPECSMFVHEWGCHDLGQMTMGQEAPPLAMLVIAFCGAKDDIARAVRTTLEKTVHVTVESEMQNPANKKAWNGITLPLVWGILKAQSSHFTMSFADFISANTQQRSDIVMSVLSPDAMREQGCQFYNLGTDLIRLHPTDFPVSFSSDVKDPVKMQKELYCVVPNISLVHQNWERLLRPSVQTGTASSGCMPWNVAASITDDSRAVQLLNAVYTQIYRLPDTIMSPNRKHALCVDMTKTRCVGAGSGMNPSIFAFLRIKDETFARIAQSPVRSRLLSRWMVLANSRASPSTLFTDMIVSVLEDVGMTVNVLPIATVIAICVTGTLALPYNERYLNINLVGPPGGGKSLILKLMSMFGSFGLIYAQQSETLAAMLCGDELLNVYKMSVTDGTWCVKIINDMCNAGSLPRALEELLQALSYEGRTDRKVSAIVDGHRKSVQDTAIGRQVVLAATNWPITNAAQDDRTGKIYIGPGGNMAAVPKCVTRPSMHQNWADDCKLMSALFMTVSTEFIAANVFMPNISPAMGWTAHIFKTLDKHGSTSQRFVERTQRIVASIAAQNLGMTRVFQRLASEPVMDNDQLILSLATPLDENILSRIICTTTPLIQKTTISDVYFPIISGIASFVNFDTQDKGGMYPIVGYTRLQDFERTVLTGLKTRHGIKVDKTSATSISDILMSNRIIDIDTTGDTPRIHVSIAAMTAIIPVHDRVESVLKLVDLIKANIGLFEQVELVVSDPSCAAAHRADDNGGIYTQTCVVITREFVRWLSLMGSDKFNEFIEQREKTPCYTFLAKATPLRSDSMWAELVNVGMLPTPRSGKPHKIVQTMSYGVQQKANASRANNIFTAETYDIGLEFMLPRSVLDNPRANVPNIVKLIHRAPRLSTVTVPVSNGEEMELPVMRPLAGTLPPKMDDYPVSLLDPNMYHTVFPTNTPPKMVMAATMATTIASTAYDHLGRLTDTMISGNPACAYSLESPWLLPPESEDDAFDNLSVVTMTARVTALLMCAHEQRLVYIDGDTNIQGTCALFKSIATMVRSLSRERMRHVWKFIRNASTKTIPANVTHRLMKNAERFFVFADPDRHIESAEIAEWVARNTIVSAAVHVNLSIL